MIKLEYDYSLLCDMIKETIQKLKDDNREYEWLLEEQDFWNRVIMNQKALKAGVLKCSLHEAMNIDISNGTGLNEMAFLLEKNLNDICEKLDKIKYLKDGIAKVKKDEQKISEDIRKNVFDLIRCYRDRTIDDFNAHEDYEKMSKMLYERAEYLTDIKADIDEKNESLNMAETLHWISEQLKKKL